MADEVKTEGESSGSKEQLSRAELRRRKILNSSADRLAKLTGKTADKKKWTSDSPNEDDSNGAKASNENPGNESVKDFEESKSSLAGWETRFMEDTDVPGSQEEKWKTPDEQDEESKSKLSGMLTDECAETDFKESENSFAGWETRFMEDVDIPGSQDEDWVDPQDEEKVQVRLSTMTVNILRMLIHVFLAVIVNVLISCDLQYLFGHAIFFPFAVTELVMWCFEFGFKKESTLMASVLMMCGIPANSVRTHTNIVGALSTCLSNYCIYFFTFIIVRKTFEHVL